MLARPAGPAAHRLDELLQAIRIDVGVDRIQLAIDLTPGALIAQSVIGTLDSDGNGDIGPQEAEAYAADVVAHLNLAVDSRPFPLTPGGRAIPSLAEIQGGTGIIRIEAAATLAGISEGRHRLDLRNDFRPDVGVYLVNALVPAASEVIVIRQVRDPLQRTLAIDYDVVRPMWRDTRLLWASIGVLVLAAAAWARRSRK